MKVVLELLEKMYPITTHIKHSQEKKEKICRERDKVGRRKLDRVKFDRHRFDRGRCGRGKFDRGKIGKFDGHKFRCLSPTNFNFTEVSLEISWIVGERWRDETDSPTENHKWCLLIGQECLAGRFQTSKVSDAWSTHCTAKFGDSWKNAISMVNNDDKPGLRTAHFETTPFRIMIVYECVVTSSKNWEMLSRHVETPEQFTFEMNHSTPGPGKPRVCELPD